MDIVNGKRFFVLGLGRSGVAVTQLLAEKGFPVVAWDDNAATRARVTDELGNARIPDEASAADVLRACDCLVMSPGVPMDHDLVRRAREARIEVSGELEIAYHFCTSKIVGVTGTNGKSTVVSLIGKILDEAGVPTIVAGNIGTPLAEFVRTDDVPDTLVLEISSFQLDTIDDFHADVAVLLNVTPDHLDRYDGSFDNYLASKARILNHADDATVFVYNDDDEGCRRIASSFRGVGIAFSSSRRLDRGVYLRDESIVLHLDGKEETVLPAREFPAVGVHNLENAMAAVAVAESLGVGRDALRSALRTYVPLPHRMEPVRTVSGVRYVNDSKATNVDAAVKSIRSIDGPLIVIMGGLDKDGDFSMLISHLGAVRTIVLIGRATDKIESVLGGAAVTHRAGTMEDAVTYAAGIAQGGDTVLLAPACASFDMFDNYGARGQSFRDAVNGLKE